jgi:glutamine amidotransferase
MSDEPLILIDAGTGNLHSVQKALETLGARVVRTQDADQVRRARRIVLPGVGAFGAFIQTLRRLALDQAMEQALQAGAQFLGICLGMQVLFEESEELGTHRGLGWLRGRVVRFPSLPGLIVPHTGWNTLRWVRHDLLAQGIPSGEYVYFNHSFYCQPETDSDLLAITEHGLPFASAVRHETIWGVQFHPEKSQKVGLRLLQNFLEQR